MTLAANVADYQRYHADQVELPGHCLADGQHPTHVRRRGEVAIPYRRHRYETEVQEVDKPRLGPADEEGSVAQGSDCAVQRGEEGADQEIDAERTEDRRAVDARMRSDTSNDRTDRDERE